MATLSRSALVPCRHIDRLPRGGDRAVGAGYAMAAAATATTLAWHALYGLASVSLLGTVAGDSVAALAPGVVAGWLYERSRPAGA